ncbi:hypothetical protein ALI22I_14960 [Saccharothrix sp. ALI-22-I]|nr:hypothetical protein ALI22I_14960 [Saccharothrix sp. ALI-22-I]
MLVLCLANYLVLLDTTIVNTAAPDIMAGLDSGLDEVLWIINAYLITFAALLVLFGRLGDRVGPRKLFVGGLVLFVLTSALCALAPNAGWLIAARAGQGVGAAMLVPQSLALISIIFPPRQRGAAFGVFTAVGGVAAVSGPVLGGLLITEFGWRSVFLLNLPVGLAGAVLALWYVPEVRNRVRSRFDPMGAALITLGLLVLVYALVESGSTWLYAASGLLVATFLLWERRHPEPLVPLDLYQDRHYRVATAITLVLSFSLAGFLLAYVVYTQDTLGMNPLMSGVSALPWTVALSAVAPLAGRFADRIGGRFLIGAGLVAFGVGIVGFASSFVWPLIAIGVGQGLAIAPTTTEALRHIHVDDAGAASGVLNTARQVGAAIGAAVSGVLLESFSHDAALVVLAVPVLAAALLTLFLSASAPGAAPAQLASTVPK